MLEPTILLAIKAVLLIGEVLYAIFAYIVVRQVSLMSVSFQSEFGPVFKLLTYIHFYAVLGLIILTFLMV